VFDDSLLVREHVKEYNIKKFNEEKLVGENLTFIRVMSK
jgi:hypothetical protein